MKSFYADCRSCALVVNDISSGFRLINVGLRPNCGMYPWLINVYLDGVVREVKVLCL